MSEKRPRSSPTGCTPKQREKRREVATFGRRKLSFNTNSQSWSDLECSALVEFIIITKGGQVWPFDKQLDFWESAARHVVQRTGIEIQRTGEHTTLIVKHSLNIINILNMILLFSGLVCRSKVTRDLSRRFPSPLAAEQELPPFPVKVPLPTIYGPRGKFMMSGRYIY